MAITWGARAGTDSSYYSKLGVEITSSQTNTSIKFTANVYIATIYYFWDNSNSVLGNWESTYATSSIASNVNISIGTSSMSTPWGNNNESSPSNYQKIASTSKIYNLDTNSHSYNFSAGISGLTSKLGSPTVTVSYTVPALPSYDVTYNGNGHTGGSTSNQTKYYNTSLILRSNGYTRTNYSFVNWNTAANGSGTSYNAGGTYTGNAALTLYAQWKINYTACGLPTNLSITDNGDNTLTFSSTVGTSGTSNASTGVTIYTTFDGSDPSESNYQYTANLSGTASSTVTTIISVDDYITYFTNGTTTVKICAKTIGSVSGYHSSLSSIVESYIMYYTSPTTPTFVRPSIQMIHAPHDFTVIWNTSEEGLNNLITNYEISLYNADTDEIISTQIIPSYSSESAGARIIVTDSTPRAIFNSEYFLPNNNYNFRVKAIGSHEGFDSDIAVSETVQIIELEAFDSLLFKVTPGEIDFFGNGDGYINVLHIDDKVSRELFTLGWEKPISTGNEISAYDIFLKDYSGTLINDWYDLDIETISFILLNDYILKESIESLYKEYTLQVITRSIYTDSYQNYDNTSEFIFRVYPASGMYLNTNNGIKRAVGFKRLEDGSWIPLRELYHRPEEITEWVTSDISTNY